MWRRRSVLIGQWSCEPVYTSYRFACFVGPTQLYGQKLHGPGWQKADAAAEIGGGRSESGLGFPFFRQMGFTFFQIFYFLLFAFLVIISDLFFFFFFFPLRQGQNRHPMSIFVNQGPQWIWPFRGGPNRVNPQNKLQRIQI